MNPFLLPLFVLGCIEPTNSRPNLGTCARPPAQSYTFGEVGIGTCLAGPTDLDFATIDGTTYLFVVNANPHFNFRDGSLLAIDWSALSSMLEAGTSRRVTMGDLEQSGTAFALPLQDDDDGDGRGINPLLGEFGLLAQEGLGVLTSRQSEGSNLRSGRDEAYVIDVSEVGDGRLSVVDTLLLQDDPMPVVVDEDASRVWVGNLTDHSISGLALTSPGSDRPFGTIGVQRGPIFGDAAFDDSDASGSLAEIVLTATIEDTQLAEDRWTLTYLAANARLWTSSVAPDDLLATVQRYESGGGSYEPALFEETGLGAARNLFVRVGSDGTPEMYADDGAGSITLSTGSAVAGAWSTQAVRPFEAAGAAAPSVVDLADVVAMYTHRDDDHIHIAGSTNGITFVDEGVVLAAEPGTTFRHPYVVFDPNVQRYRMWMSVLRDGQWSIGLTDSEDGRDWAAVRDVLALPEDVAAPSIDFLDGHYGMWFSIDDGAGWDDAFAVSYDGHEWSEIEVIVDKNDLATVPNRSAVRADALALWRIEGRDQGLIDDNLFSGQDESPSLPGFLVALTAGQEVSNDIVGQRLAQRALVPSSVMAAGLGDRVFATATDAAARTRLVALLNEDGQWQLDIRAADFETMLDIGPGEQPSKPVVVQNGTGFLMFYALTDGTGTRIHRATSPDGVTWTPDGTGPLLADAPREWDATRRVPHSAEPLPSGALRLWYAGGESGSERISSAIGQPLGAFEREFGLAESWRFGTGQPGSFDDSAVKDPLVITIDGETRLFYAGFDGARWHLGSATLQDDGTFVRRGGDEMLSVSALTGPPRGFGTAGVTSPVRVADEDGQQRLYIAGFDGFADRIGTAIIRNDTPDVVFATPRYPTANDTIAFSTVSGGQGTQAIELEQTVEAFAIDGTGMSSMTYDEERGAIYVTSKLHEHITVVDVRDDSTGGFIDANAFDIETLLLTDLGPNAGFRGSAVQRSRNLLYASMRNPDGLAVLDMTRWSDNNEKEVVRDADVAVLPLPSAARDAGAETFAAIGGDDVVITDNEALLLASHFNGNGLAVFDLDLGPWGEEIAWIDNIGENPHRVALSPDQRWAVVGNFVGETDGATAHSTLAVVNIDPESDSYLDVVAWLVNL